MLSFTLAQMRRSLGRLTAAGIAIVIGAAFVTAAMLASSIVQRGATDALTARFAQADLVVTGEVTAADIDDLVGVDGLAAAHASALSFGQLAGDDQGFGLPVTGAAEDPALRALDVVQGEVPGAGEITLPVDVAERLGLEIGDEVTVTRSIWVPADAGDPSPDEMGGDGDWVEQPEQLRLAGLTEDPAGVFSMTGGSALIDPDTAIDWVVESWPADGPADIPIDHVIVTVAPDADVDTVRDTLAAAVEGGPVDVQTREQAAAVQAEQLTGEANALTAIGLAFASIALIVAGLVISNTFQVLVAQRTRSLALLRCVGASARQLRRSVTLEALLLGVGTSLVGILAGSGLAQLTLTLLRRTAGGAGLPATIELTPMIVLVPLLAGTVVAWFASIAPARAASRVAPLAAMRPADTSPTAARSGRVRLGFSLALIVVGAVLLALGVVAASAADVLIGLAVGILGGLLSFVGVLLGAVFWIPRAIGAAAALITRRSRPATRLAAANSLRNPRRTAATSSALLIGVTLVAMMSTAANTARASFDQEFDRTFPVDVAVERYGPEMGVDDAELDPARATEVAALEGVGAVATLDGISTLRIESDGESLDLEGLAADPSEVIEVARDTDAFSRLDDRTILVPRHLADLADMAPGDRVEVTAYEDGTGAPLGDPRPLTVQVADLEGVALVSTQVGGQLDPDAATAAVWVRLDAGADPNALTAEIQQIVRDDAAGVFSPAAERASYERVVSTLLAVVVGLLGVAVVIALVGVANTLSLSVIERRRESATLRAIGLTRRQLRQTLAVESLFIAGAGTVLGVLLGTFYGWVGARTVLGVMADGVTLAVPWRDLGLIVAVSLVAGVVASILPGRRAARTSPVAALATE